MKKIITLLSVFILISLFNLKAQQNLELTDRHEVKLNLGSSVFMAFPEMSYEYILNEDMSVGTAVGFGFGENNGDRYKFKAMPFWRWFFSSNLQQPATGFFIEANGAVGSRYIDKNNLNSNSSKSETTDTMFTTGLGLAIGGKYLSKNNWTAEILAGVGRNFIYDNSYANESLYARIGISIGKRF